VIPRWVLLVLALLLLLSIQVMVVLNFGAEQVQGNVAFLTLPVSVWFMSLYARDPWWKSWFGRSLMLIAVAISVDVAATVLFRRFGDYPGRDVMLIVSADLTFLAMLIRTLVLRAEQKADRDDHFHRRPR
jgi:hypothetical protein